MVSQVFLFSMPGGMEWVLILVAILVLFGGKKIPELAKGIGKGIREFKDAKNQVTNEISKEANQVDDFKS